MTPGDGSSPLQHERALRGTASQTYSAICLPLHKPYNTTTSFAQASNALVFLVKALVLLVKGTHRYRAKLIDPASNYGQARCSQ